MKSYAVHWPAFVIVRGAHVSCRNHRGGHTLLPPSTARGLRVAMALATLASAATPVRHGHIQHHLNCKTSRTQSARAPVAAVYAAIATKRTTVKVNWDVCRRCRLSKHSRSAPRRCAHRVIETDVKYAVIVHVSIPAVRTQIPSPDKG